MTAKSVPQVVLNAQELINMNVLNVYQALCTITSHQLNNIVEWISAKEGIKKKVVTSVSPAEIYRLIMKKLLLASVIKGITNKQIMSVVSVQQVVQCVMIVIDLTAFSVHLKMYFIIYQRLYIIVEYPFVRLGIKKKAKSAIHAIPYNKFIIQTRIRVTVSQVITS